MKRSTWILFVVFVLLAVGGYFLAERMKSVSSEKLQQPLATVTETKNVFDFQESAVSELKIQNKLGKVMSMKRSETGWTLTEPTGVQTDNAVAESGMTQLMSLTILSSLEATTGLGQFGLATPAYTLTLTLQDGKVNTLVVGNVSPTGRGFYVRLDSGALVMVNQYSLEAVLGMVESPPIVQPTATLTPTETLVVTLTAVPMTPEPPTATPAPATATP